MAIVTAASRRRRAVVVAALAMSLSAACSGDAGTGTEETPGATGSTSSPSPGAQTVAAGPCANAYMPVVRGASWTYELSEPAGTVYTDTVTAVEDLGFTITTDFDRLTKRTDWACTAQGLTALTYGSGPAASLSVGGLQASFETTDVNGVTLPADLSAGDRWRQTFQLSGRLDVGGERTRVAGSVDYVLHARGDEKVDVPAGTFDALAVDTDITLDLVPASGGLGIPLTLELHGVQWFARDVGLVRSETDGDFFGGSISSVAELTAYDVGA